MKNNLAKRFSTAKTAVFFLMTAASCLHAEQGLRREVWTNISSPSEEFLAKRPAFFGPPYGLTMSPDFYAPPAATDVLQGTVSLNSSGRTYGARLRGYLVAPATGDYTFWDSGADTVAVYLSIDENPNGKRLIVSHRSYSADQQHTRRAPLKSAPVRLVEGNKYYIEVIHTSDSGSDGLALCWEAPNNVRITIPATALEPYTPPAPNPPGLTREFFPNIEGTSLDDLTSSPAFHRPPARSDIVTSSSYSKFAKNYGVRIRGCIKAPATGDYTLWECGGGDVSVSLATDDNPTAIHQSIRLNDRPNKTVRAFHSGSTPPGEWTVCRDQQSKPVHLIAGKRYYIEILHKAGEGEDHLAVAWQAPGGVPELIPLSALESYRRADTDLDDDGMPDALERAYGLDPTNAEDAAGDLDGDGIFNDEAIRAGADPSVRSSVSGMVIHDFWKDVAGDSQVLDQDAFKFAFTHPVAARSVAVATLVHGEGRNGLRRLRGYITAPVGGQFTFWAGANGDSALYLSTTASKFDRQLLIKTAGRNPYGRLDVNATQKSPPVTLVAGEKYYFELWTKHGDGHAVANLAWQIPGEPRENIPSRYLSTYAGEANDKDDDYLDDDWERANGFNPDDDGRKVGSKDGAFGDLQGDGLTNLQKFMLRGQLAGGVSGYDQANFYLSDVLAGAVGSFATVATLNGDAYTASFGEWTKQNGQAWQRGRRGSVTYPIAVSKSGVHAFKFTASSRIDGGVNEGYDFRISLNGKVISYQTITIPENGTSTLAVLTPWLNAGEAYQIELFVDNSYLSRRISVDKVETLAARGTDSNGNGVPDWVEIRLNNTNGFDHETIRSRTSPATVEGRARYFDFLNTGGLPVTKAPNGHFFAEVPLTPGTPGTLQFGFENNALARTAIILWEPTNLLQDPDAITIRQGDSLLFTAFRNSAQAAGESYTLSVNGQTFDNPGTQSIPVAFTTAGTQTIELAHTDAGGKATTRSVTVNVLPTVGIESPLCVTGCPRLWTHGHLPAGAAVQFDDNITNWREPAAGTYTLISTIPQSQPFLVRHGDGGPILGSG